MGPSGGGQTSNTTAEFPVEFKPLAADAVSQLQALQQVNPIADFAKANPRQIAALSPLQQMAINNAPGLLNPTQGLQGLLGLSNPLSQIAQSSVNVPTQPGFTAAMNALSQQLGAGQPGVLPGPAPALNTGALPTSLASLFGQ